MHRMKPYHYENLMCENRIRWDFVEPFFKLVLILGGITIIVISIQNNILFQSSLEQFTGKQSLFLRFLFALSLSIFSLSLIFRTLLWFRYRSYNSAEVQEWPDVSVVVPAFNEGKPIYDTIRSITRSQYPAGRLHIIAINDGSSDNTGDFIQKAKHDFSPMVDTITFAHNMGKRKALYDAFKRVDSEFVITIDSDTVLEASSIREIITPMLLNQKIGAVTGRIRVLNHNSNILTKMLNAHFAMAFDFSRAVQSTFSTVLCVAGAFSAYRTSAVREVVDQWLDQTFLKTKCTYGEDRSLTNYILKTGFDSFFQRTAVSHTLVPEKLTGILKMLTRWARSNIRESIIFSKILINGNRKGNTLFPFIEFSSTVLMIMIHFIWFYYFLFSGLISSSFVFRVIAYSILFGFLYMVYFIRIEGRKDSPYIIVFSIFSSIFMIWIFTVAGLSLTKKGWSTR